MRNELEQMPVLQLCSQSSPHLTRTVSHLFTSAAAKEERQIFFVCAIFLIKYTVPNSEFNSSIAAISPPPSTLLRLLQFTAFVLFNCIVMLDDSTCAGTHYTFQICI